MSSAQDPEDEPWTPLLVVEGRSASEWTGPLVMIGFVALVLATALLAYFGKIPWLPRGVPLYLIIINGAFVKLVLIPLGAIVGLVVMRHVHARTGRVEFFRDRIAFSKREGAVEVHWSDLSSYRDDAAEFVQLVRKEERFTSSHLTIPTPSESVRVRVLALLDERGLRRDG